MPEISIIVPTHNSIKYIKECLNSIITQDFEDIEVICIDSSSDSTTDYLASVSDNDSRVHIITDPNGSWGHKLNAGISQAAGKWLMFVDSDDIQSKGMVKDLYGIAETTDADIVRSDFYWLFTLDNKNCLMRRRFHIEPKYHDRLIDCDKEPEFRKKMFGHHWACIYKKSLFTDNDIMVNETPGASYQDVGLWVQASMCAKKMYYHTKPYYQYRIDNNTSSIRNMSKSRSYISENLYAFNEVKKKGLIKSDNDLEMLLRYRLEYYEMVYDRLEGEALRIFLETAKEDIDRIAAADKGFIDSYFSSKPDIYKLLTDDPDAVSKYEKTLQDAKAGYIEAVNRMKEAREIVLCGTGYSAFLMLSGNRLSGCADFLAVCDDVKNDNEVWLDRYTILSPESAAETYPDALYVVASSDCDRTVQTITRLGIPSSKIVSFDQHLSFEIVYEMNI